MKVLVGRLERVEGFKGISIREIGFSCLGR